MFGPKRQKTKLAKTNGFTLIEILVVLAILGVLMLASYPSILNSLETRTLENTARDIRASLHRA